MQKVSEIANDTNMKKKLLGCAPQEALTSKEVIPPINQS
jgi:hypothetical protein